MKHTSFNGLRAQVENSYKNSEKLIKKLDDEITRRTEKLHKDRKKLDAVKQLREKIENYGKPALEAVANA